jgi:two-component system chemotaxis response regulator CheY
MRPDCLIVDDSRLVRHIASTMLEDMGLATTQAASGEEALIHLGQNIPQLLLVDWNMPGISGLELISKIRALPDVAQPRIILFSTETRRSEVRIALRAGADCYLLKPFDAPRMAKRLRRFGLIAPDA